MEINTVVNKYNLHVNWIDPNNFDNSFQGKISVEHNNTIKPVVTINEDVYGKLVADDVDGIIDKYEAL